MADRLPDALDDALKGRHWEMAKALGAMNPKQLWEFVPMVFPMTNRHPIRPMLAIFPVDEWTRAGAPYLSTKGWCKFCIILSENNREGLKDVFEVATKELEACHKREGKECSSTFNKVISHYRPTVVDTAGASTDTPKVCINYGGNEDDMIEV